MLGVSTDEENKLVFKVKFPEKICWISNKMMRTRFPYELINYYEKYLTLTIG